MSEEIVQLYPDAGLYQIAPCGQHSVGQQEVYERETLRQRPWGPLDCGLTLFYSDQTLQTFLRKILDITGFSSNC